MSGYQPKKGDRVRVVVEGEVTYTNCDGFDVEEGPFFAPAAEWVVSVEKVTPPLPTTPGSVIYWLHSFVHLSEKGSWIDDNGDSARVDKIHEHDFDVIFDAGAES